MPHISLEDRLARLEKMFNARKPAKRYFEADDEESSEDAGANKENLDKAAEDPEVQKKVDAISKSLKDAGLIEYVSDINKMMSDEKGKLALELVAGTLSDDQLEELGLTNVKFKLVANKATPVSHLHPTQNEIGFPNSLSKPVANKFNCIPELVKGQSVKLGIPIITCNGKLIIDGHHRWSQAACVNPDATMEALDLQIDTGVSGIDFADAEDVLKVTQSLIMAIALKSGKSQLPSADSDALQNLYAMSAQQLFDSIVDFNGSHDGLKVLAGTKRIGNGNFTGDVASRVDKAISSISDERVAAVKDSMDAWSDLDGDVKAAVYLTANCLALPKPDSKATQRKYMPQTNGGDDMKITMGDLEDAAKKGLNVKEGRYKTAEKMAKLESRLDRIEKILRNRRR